MGGKFDEFGESSMIHQPKTIQISSYNNNLLGVLLIWQTLLCKMLEESIRQTFPPPNSPTIW